jgi:flavin-dependent dehydrogenase
MTQRVDIYGAGLAGLTAGLHLARRGMEVHLYDREQRIGGNPKWHPSIQTTTLDIAKTSEYLQIDLSACFHKVDAITFYRYGRKDQINLPNMYACERGPRPTSLDSYLGELALEAGATFHPGVPLSTQSLGKSQAAILATGLDADVYQMLGLPHTPLYGYRGVMRSELRGMLLSYMLPCTNYDFAYLAGEHGLIFALLFSRKSLGEHNLPQFEEYLAQTENLHFSRWIYSQGALPTRPNLIWQGKVLAGSLSGMIDPFVLHGMSGALTSGKVAAQYFYDPAGALAEFKHLKRNFYPKQWLKQIGAWLPWKSALIPVLMWADAHLHGVGFVK